MDAIYRRTTQCDSDDNIEFALQLVENEGFRMAFFCSSIRRANAVAEKLRERVYDHCVVHKLCNGFYEFVFNNRSMILVGVPIDYVRGYRMHAIIIDYDAPDNIAKHCLIKYPSDCETG